MGKWANRASKAYESGVWDRLGTVAGAGNKK
jgi:hypothetical protein